VMLPHSMGSCANLSSGKHKWCNEMAKSLNGLKITEKMVGRKFGEFASTGKPSSSGKRASPSKTKVKPCYPCRS
ncbi:hypothetical protein CY35_01G144400, partial [Sphagnum magellanicum]